MNRELLVLFPVNCEITFEYDDDSSDDNDSVLEQDGAEPQLLNKELGFLFTFLTKVRKTDRIKTFFFLVNREMPKFIVREV